MTELSLKKWDVFISTWFGSGLLKPAPGTWGSLAALPLIFIVNDYGLLVMGLVTIFLYAIGHIAITSLQKRSFQHDAGYIVIDEVIGMFIVFMFVSGGITQIIAGFLLFRFFDILKPWPIGYIEKKTDGAFGVMIDDIIAGLFAGLIVLAGRMLGFV